ncbi:ankyrin [Byssothecium circinans]|uniref:Ankyrin n=1 Tax=Byssothecium circinans TaxID=147558 RepID=A0A6A5UDN5_9PLEO|nr:ankyrin [Byssothecium circinans]
MIGRTPLHCAASLGSVESILVLLQNGAQQWPLDSCRRTPFMVACWEGKISSITALQNTQIDMDMADLWGLTALHLSALQSNVRIFIDLIHAGWDPYRMDFQNKSSIYHALLNPHLANYVYASGLDLTRISSSINIDMIKGIIRQDVNLRRFFSRFPTDKSRSLLQQLPTDELYDLCCAAANGNLPRMKILLKFGADSEISDDKTGTALITACLTGCLASVKFLVRNGAKFESSFRGRSLNAVLAAREDSHILRWLLVGRFTDQGKIPNSPASNDQSEDDRKRKPWSGIRQMQVPLTGEYARAPGMSLLGLAKRCVNGVVWREMVPLG